MILNIFSMKRSGQHAIINWLCEQNKPALHFNACNENRKPMNFVIEYKDNKKIKHKNTTFKLNEYRLVIFNFEDKPIYKFNGENVVILRSPKNWIASRLETNIKDHKISIWKSHAISDLFKISFDKWFSDNEYRKFICSNLKLTFTDIGLNDVFWHGKSSFDKSDFDGKAQDMNVLERWKKYKNEVRKIIDGDMLKLWNEIN